MTKCKICDSNLEVKVLKCGACNVSYHGDFLLPRIARFSIAEQQLVESLVLHGGNLKEMAESLSMSYPTLKKRLDGLRSSLEEKMAQDKSRIEKILEEIEGGTIKPEEGIRMIQELNGEL